MDKLQLQVGKTYVARNGGLVDIVNNDGHAIYPFDGSNSRSYRKDGLEHGVVFETEHDLIGEFVATTPDPQATADAIFAEAQQNTPAPEPVGVLGTPPSSEQRNEHIAKIIVHGMIEGHEADQIRDFINLYDSAVDGTSQPVKAA